jgi:hypothetical protein
MRIDQSLADHSRHPLRRALTPGIYPYLSGSVPVDELRRVAKTYDGAVVPGLAGAKLARQVDNILVDPAVYQPGARDVPGTLFGYDEWLERQRAANVPVVLTDTPRIRNGDRTALRTALARWEMAAEPTIVVLPIEPWWLKDGLPCLVEDVQAAGRPVAVVLLHRYNGLDAAGAVAGLVEFASAVNELPVVSLRSDVSAVGAVAHGSFAGFVGMSDGTRHGQMPRRPSPSGKQPDNPLPDQSPNIFLPAFHDYVKASKLPAFARAGGRSIAQCDDDVCRGQSLLRITRLAELDLASSRAAACGHNVASVEQAARLVFGSEEPRDAWWELCRAGADMSASLIENGIMLPVSRWLRQWLELGSPSHDPAAVD